MKKSAFFVLLAVGATTVAVAASRGVSCARPVVLLSGAYTMTLDRAKQTFNGHLAANDRPLVQTENFTTTCSSVGCIARSVNKRPPPAWFFYHWANGQWESAADQQQQYFVCNDGSKVNSVKSDVIRPNGDGSFSGERTITVSGEGCPGDGAGKYWLPFTLKPIK